MPEMSNARVVESFAAALETMAFVSVMPADEPVVPPNDAVLIEVSFKGPTTGRFELVASQDLGRLLLDNTVGCDPSETLMMPSPTDPLIELANIGCGMMLNRDGKGGKYEMGVPRVTTFDVGARWKSFVGASDPCDLLSAEGSTVVLRVIERIAA